MLCVWYKSVNFDAETDLALEKGVPFQHRVRGIHTSQERLLEHPSQVNVDSFTPFPSVLSKSCRFVVQIIDDRGPNKLSRRTWRPCSVSRHRKKQLKLRKSSTSRVFALSSFPWRANRCSLARWTHQTNRNSAVWADLAL